MSADGLYQRALHFDPDRAMSSRFAASDKRQGLNLISVVDGELMRIPRSANDPLLRGIRFQFWRDALAANDGGSHPDVMLVLRLFDSSPELVSALSELVDVHEDASGNTADRDTRIRTESRRQALLFETSRTWLSGEYLPTGDEISKQCGALFAPVRLLMGGEGDTLLGAAERAAILSEVFRGYTKLRERLQSLSPAELPAFLPLALLPTYLRHLTKQDSTAVGPSLPHPLLRLFWLWQAARRGF